MWYSVTWPQISPRGAACACHRWRTPRFFSIEDDDGYVRIEQSLGNQVLYTPNEARDIAEAILDAVDEAVEDS